MSSLADSRHVRDRVRLHLRRVTENNNAERRTRGETATTTTSIIGLPAEEPEWSRREPTKRFDLNTPAVVAPPHLSTSWNNSGPGVSHRVSRPWGRLGTGSSPSRRLYPGPIRASITPPRDAAGHSAPPCQRRRDDQLLLDPPPPR
ncbi:unnamed protein product [Gadus morhua 'NCC']